MLVVCYTNHALDQFLEGLLSYTDSIVRIGGQSKNENLKNFYIRNVRSEYPRNGSTKRLFWEKWNALQDCERVLKMLHEYWGASMSYECIVNCSQFVNKIPMLKNTWFDDASTEEFQNWLLEGRTQEQQLQDAIELVSEQVRFNM